MLVVVHLQGSKPLLSSEEIQAKFAAHAAVMKSQAQQAAAALNMPSYLNPSVVNPQQYALQTQKRKLLWSSKKKEVHCADMSVTPRNFPASYCETRIVYHFLE